MGARSWLPLVPLDLCVDVVVVVTLIDVHFGLHHLSVLEGVQRLVGSGGEAGLLYRLFGCGLPHNWGTQSWLNQSIILVQVRSLFLSDHSCLLDVAVSVTFQAKAAKSSALHKLHVWFISSWFGFFVFLFSFLNFTCDRESWRFLI